MNKSIQVSVRTDNSLSQRINLYKSLREGLISCIDLYKCLYEQITLCLNE
jgi:hypothetical protein